MKTKTYIWGLLGSMMLAGCATEDIFDGAVATMPVGLTAYVNNEAETTRMTVSDLGETSPGEEAMNENLLNTIDVFFYPHASDMTEAAVYHLFEKVNMQNRWTLTQAISDADLKTICGVTTLTAGDNCTVYILANYGADENGNSKFSGTETREQLRQMKLKADFNPKSGDTFLKQDNFVMEGTALAELTGQGIFTLSGQVPLRRVASKVRLAVTIAPQAEAGVTDVNGTYTWVPQPETMKVMLTHGVNKGIVCTVDDYLYDYPTADAPIYFPKETENENAWTTYGRNMDQTSVKDGKTWYEHEVPFYSYRTLDWKYNADNEAYLSLSMRWVHQDDADKGVVTYYQIPIAQRLTDPSLSLKSYRYYRTEIELGVMGSFDVDDPVTLTDNSYIIVDWGTNEIDDMVDNATVLPSMVEVAYLAVQANRDTLNNVTSHGVPYVSSHEIEYAYVSKVEYINTYDFQDRTINNTTDLDGQLTVNTYVNNETFRVSTTDGLVTLHHNISANQYTRYNVTVKIRNTAGLEEEIIYTIYPAIYADVHDGGDTFIDGYFGYINNPSGNNWWQIQGSAYASGTYNANYPNRGYERYNNATTYVHTPYGVLYRTDRTSAGQVSLTRITISSFSEDNSTYTITNQYGATTTYNYKISDPRTESNWNGNSLVAHLVSQAATGGGNANNRYRTTTSQAWTDAQASAIKVGASDPESISPDIYISSRWGACGNEQLSFTNAQKRAATYQEAGFPAGRWRLPTEAELMFIYNLQDKGIIPSLFTEGVSYWASSGRYINDGRFYTGGNNTTCYMRSVYDIWYWGNDPMDTKVYHVAP